MSSLSHRYYTTPIYYANGSPHAGHVYTTLLASILKRHSIARGFSCKMLTGMDEHGEAVEQRAKEENKEPQQLVDELAIVWEQSFQRLGVNYDIFLRTTSPAHIANVQSILTQCFDKGDIYYGEHDGHYCVRCESFLTSSERDSNDNCLVHKKPTEKRTEGNYFFRTSKYKNQIKTLIENKQITIQERFSNELLSILENLEGDLSISRPKTRLTWGVELPFDKSHVAYVWFDALPNYITGLGGIDAARTSSYWENVSHILGKDILKFHGIFWPAICLSLGIKPAKLLVTGWILKDGHKMSKSLGNVLSFTDIVYYGKDMFTNYVFRSVNPGEDIDVSWRTYFERFNADLANGVGNLLSRSLSMVEKYFERKIPAFIPEKLTEDQKNIVFVSSSCSYKVSKQFDDFCLADALNEIWGLISLADKHITEAKPWNLFKQGDSESMIYLSQVLAVSIGVLRIVGCLAHAFFPEKMIELLESIGEDTNTTQDFYDRCQDFFAIKSGHIVTHFPKLFQRIDIEAEMMRLQPFENAQQPKKSSTVVNECSNKSHTLKCAGVENDSLSYVSIEDFAKVDIRVGRVLRAEVVEGSDKLIKLLVAVGDLGEKTIFAGLRQWVNPEDLANRKVLVVANLKPRKMKFGVSEGMLLATDTCQDRISPLFLSEDFKDGSRLS